MIERMLIYLEQHTFILYVSLILLTVITSILTLLPSKITSITIFQYDKIGHMLIFGLWTFLLGLIQLVSDRKPLPLLAIFIAGSLFGISLEILQEVLPIGRHMNLYDALADLTGCLIAIGLLRIITSFSSYGYKSMEQ